MDKYKFEITDEETNIRIDKFLSSKLEDMSRSSIQKLADNENITVNNAIVKSKYKVHVGDIIEVIVPEPEEVSINPENIPLDIVYEDDDVIVINKPNGMVVHPAPGHYSGTLVNALLYHCGEFLSGINGEKRPGIVHRIDKETTGLLVVAKNDNAHKDLSEQLQTRSLKRVYYALVHGVIKHRSGTIDAPIGRDPKDRKKMTVTSKNSKEAITSFEVIESFNNFTLVKCQLKTGRTHQIRVHFNYIDHPLVGDKTYGPKKPFTNDGQLLHAKEIGFVHPTTDENVSFSSELPEFFEKVLRGLRNRS